MRRKLSALALILILAIQLTIPGFAADAATACRSPQRLRVNGAYIECEMYNINDNNYFKLRDLAYLLRDTADHFSLTYDAEWNRILVTTGEDYVPTGVELDLGKGDRSGSVQPGTQPIWIDGELREITEYNIADNNYFRLRDLAPYLGFRLDWIEDGGIVVVESSDYLYTPHTGDWVSVSGERSVVFRVESSDADSLTASLRYYEDGYAGKTLQYADLVLNRTDAGVYTSEWIGAGLPQLSLMFDGDHAVLRFLRSAEGETEHLPEDAALIWAESPLSARGTRQETDSVVRLFDDAIPVYGGTLRRAAVFRPVRFSDAEMEEIAATRFLPLPADVGGDIQLSEVERVSYTEYTADNYRLIYEGDSWALCYQSTVYALSAEGIAQEVFFISDAMESLVPPGTVLYVSVRDYAVTAADTSMPCAKRFAAAEIGGKQYDSQSEAVDLSMVPQSKLDTILPELQNLTNVKTIELMRADGSTGWNLASAKKLQDAMPSAMLHYAFDLYGKTVSTEDEEIIYDSVKIGDEGAQIISDALDVLKNCKRFVLDGCGISNWIMANIRDAHPNTKVVWRIYCGGADMLTDETMLRLTFRLDDNNSYLLQYCTDVTYLDVGHNSDLHDISFAQYMPKLECAIFSGAPLWDISCLASCKNLVWLELCFCGFLSDISVLKDHPTLTYLNISDTAVSDISALENVHLERFNCQKTRISAEAERHFIETHPECLSIFRNTNEYGYGWRYDDYGYTFFWYYRQMRDIFRYDDKNFHCNHKGA